MSSAIPRSNWVKLYKQLQREAAQFPEYNYRAFAQRRIRDHFEANRGVTDPAQLSALYQKGVENLNAIRRQVAIGTLYPHNKTVVEQKVNTPKQECVKCKSNEYTNKNIVMMINECGHPLCRNCVDNLFARNAAPCHICGRTLRKNNFWEQLFDDPMIEKENYHRRRLKKIYNLKAEDFGSLREFNDYLERLEYLVANLTAEVDLEETEAEITAFKDTNAELIDRNRRKLDADQLWVLQNLKDEAKMKDRLASIYQQDTEEQQHNAITDSKAIIEELRQSEENAEAILDRERKRQIEIDLEEKEKAAERKRHNRELIQSRKRAAETMSFATAQRQIGRSYVYQPLTLLINGPPVPPTEDLESLGYLAHIRKPSEHRRAGGFTAETGCERALFDSRIDLFAC